MKTRIIALFLFASVSKLFAQSLETFHDFTAETILGDTISMSAYAGKKVLVVNTASFCSYTPQYEELQALDSIYSSYNFEVIGFPCNDFGGQEPSDDSTIYAYCTGIYGVTFQMMSKISITAPDTAEVYKWLQLQSRNGVANAPVTWNFNKYCIDEAGHWVMHFPQQTDPLDTAITNWIMTPSVTGINSVMIKREVKIKMNPVKDYFSVLINNCNATNAVVLLYSAEGVLVDKIFSGEINSNMELFYAVDNLRNGIYYLKALLDDEEKVVKICVLK